MEKPYEKYNDLQVGDVYDLAAQIGKEFEKVIDQHGLEVVQALMPKVINALEHLEASALNRETKHDEVQELQAIIDKMEYEKMERAEYRHKFEQEVEQIEENWKKETNQLSELVSRLQDENHRLSSLLAEKDHEAIHTKVDCVTDDVKLAQKLKELVDKQREQLHAKDKELLHRNADIDQLKHQCEKLGQTNSEHFRRLKHLQSQIRILVEEKSDLQAQVQDQHREIQVLQKRLSMTMKENMDLVKGEGSPILDFRKKLVIDPDDPNRPRFTLEELRNILFERNDLKARVSELEDELNLYRPKPEKRIISPLLIESDDEGEEDLPVQGPINREPDDKLFPGKRTMGIRRFFQKIWQGIESNDPSAITTLVPFPAFRPSTGPF